MKRFLTKILMLALLLPLLPTQIFAQDKYKVEVDAKGDTTYCGELYPVLCMPTFFFVSRRQEKFYWRTVRDVKKTLPYARIVSATLNKANEDLSHMPNPVARKRYLDALEKDVKKKYTPVLWEMTRSQGNILIKLINRETNMTSFDLIKLYRGTLSAYFWNGVAHLFGANLMDTFGVSDQERIINRVILLVEMGQL